MAKIMKHLKTFHSTAIRVRDKFFFAGLEAYIAKDGIQLHLEETQLPIAKKIADELNLVLEDGILPSTQKLIQQNILKIMEANNV